MHLLSSWPVKSGDTGDYLMVTRTFRQLGGNRARWHEETDIVFGAICHPGTASQVAGGDTWWSAAPFVNRGEWIRRYQVDVGHSVLIIFKIFVGFYSRRPETFKSNDEQDSSLLGRDDRVQWRREVLWLSNFVVFKTLKFVDASNAFSFLSEWQVPLVGILTNRMMFHSNEISLIFTSLLSPIKDK